METILPGHSHPHHSQSGWQLNRYTTHPLSTFGHTHTYKWCPGYIVFINPSISWQILSCHRLSASTSTASVWVRQTNGKGIGPKQRAKSEKGEAVEEPERKMASFEQSNFACKAFWWPDGPQWVCHMSDNGRQNQNPTCSGGEKNRSNLKIKRATLRTLTFWNIHR